MAFKKQHELPPEFESVNHGKSDKVNNTIGTNIRNLRLFYGETQKQLGDIVGYGATTIANYESGLRKPDIRTLKIIANRYHVTLDDLLSGEIDPAKTV